MLSITVLNRWLQRVYGHLFRKIGLQHGFRSERPKTVKVAQTTFSYKNGGACQKDLPKLSNFAAPSGSGFSGLKDDQDYDDKILFIR
jgi:hypothetical protein